MRLVPWQPDDLLRRLDDVVSVYGEAMGYRPELLQTRRGYIGAHVRRAGPIDVALRLLRGRRAARPPDRAGPRGRCPPVARAAGHGRRQDRAALHAGGRRAEVPRLAAVPPVP